MPKYHERIEAYGTLDELNSYIGLLCDQAIGNHYKDVLQVIQDRIFTIESLLATDPEHQPVNPLPQMNEDDIVLLENEIDKMNEMLPPINSFILPGGHTIVSYAHIARCVCRRAERLTIRLSISSPVEMILIRYLNRLSDYLFVLARYIALEMNVAEKVWKPIR